MIVFLGNSGKFPDTASFTEGLTYFVLLLLMGGLTTVPMIWTIIWLVLFFNGIEISWGDGLVICYQLGIAVLSLFAIYYVTTKTYELGKTFKKRRQNDNRYKN